MIKACCIEMYFAIQPSSPAWLKHAQYRAILLTKFSTFCLIEGMDVDPNHMVTVGEEGFYGFGAPAASIATNPNSDNTGSAYFALLPSHPISPLETSSSFPRLLESSLNTKQDMVYSICVMQLCTSCIGALPLRSAILS